MEKLREYQRLLIQFLKAKNLDEAAIFFVVLTLREMEEVSAMLLFLAENPDATQEECMEIAQEYHETMEEMKEQGLI